KTCPDCRCGIRHICDDVLGEHPGGSRWNRDGSRRKTVGVNEMSSKGSVSGIKTDAKRGLRVGVVGAGVMGTNHGRVLSGLPNTTLVGIVDPLPEHRARATEHAGCRTF